MTDLDSRVLAEKSNVNVFEDYIEHCVGMFVQSYQKAMAYEIPEPVAREFAKHMVSLTVQYIHSVPDEDEDLGEKMRFMTPGGTA